MWLQSAGYNTYYTGKLFNAHTVENYDSPDASGFTGSVGRPKVCFNKSGSVLADCTQDFLLDPFTYQYLNSSYQRNKDPPVSHAGEHSVDVLAGKAYGFLEEAVEAEKPFFLAIAPVAPHSNVEITNLEGPVEDIVTKFTPPIPAARHAHLFKNVKVPRTENFNPKKPSGANWIRKLERQSRENIDANDHFYRNRLRTIQSVDEIVDGVLSRLEKYGILDDTYIIFTSDNGYHIGQHRLQPGKECSFEEDINIPLIIRGPGVPGGETTDLVTTHTDLAPTILQLAGAQLRADFDGEMIPLTKLGIKAATNHRHEHVNVEYWGFAVGEGDFDKSN